MLQLISQRVSAAESVALDLLSPDAAKLHERNYANGWNKKTVRSKSRSASKNNVSFIDELSAANRSKTPQTSP
jgi:hypothetical protein